MTFVVTIIPEQGATPETLFINHSSRNYDDIKDCSISYTEHCKYMSITLDGEITTRVFFRTYSEVVKWCKTYIRESENIVKVDDNTGATSNQENWYSNVIKTKAEMIAQYDPENYGFCLYCKNAFKIKSNRKKFCSNQHKTNYHLAKLRVKKKAEKEQQTLDK